MKKCGVTNYTYNSYNNGGSSFGINFERTTTLQEDGQHSVNYVDEINYLGVVMQSTLKFNIRIANKVISEKTFSDASNNTL